MPPKGPGIETSSRSSESRSPTLKQRTADQAIDKLESSEKKIPALALVKIYHSCARDGIARKKVRRQQAPKRPKSSIPKPFDDGNDLMRDALATPEDASTLLEWAKTTIDEIVTYLVEFAESRIEYADAWNEKLDRQQQPDPKKRCPTRKETRDVLGDQLRTGQERVVSRGQSSIPSREKSSSF